MKVLLAALLVAALLTGCVQDQGEDIHATMKSWNGANVDEVILAWGPPARTAELQNGMRVMEWHQERRVFIPSAPVTYGTVTAPNGQSANYVTQTSGGGGSVAAWTCYRRFNVNQDNIITGGSYDGC